MNNWDRDKKEQTVNNNDSLDICNWIFEADTLRELF